MKRNRRWRDFLRRAPRLLTVTTCARGMHNTFFRGIRSVHGSSNRSSTAVGRRESEMSENMDQIEERLVETGT
ncbi:hypothetical protein L596_021879 [Steinernema carpocapsae]|uniref:Uncharacterized protein n=1 Tax=Steinernema carpocapsae TaxID=34508 RepID=A0A4U5MKF4_STECR|nr:hypothetical protein L596_021879 [Steinernema carpocapsae]